MHVVKDKRLLDAVLGLLGNPLAANQQVALASNADIANSCYVVTHKIRSMSAESSSVLHKHLLPQRTRVYDKSQT